MSTLMLGNVEVGRGLRPKWVAEMCNNFAGDLDTALRMIDAAVDIGVDICKFQLRTGSGRLNLDEHERVLGHCAMMGVEYGASAFDLQGVDWLEQHGVKWVKLPSGRIGDWELIHAAKNAGLAIVGSLGMATAQECVTFWNRGLENGFYPGMMMHTTSIYPTSHRDASLGHLQILNEYAEERGLCPAGFSSHCPSIGVTIGAVALGAALIEHHFSLDTSQPGPDQSSSLTPDVMSRFIIEGGACWASMQDKWKYIRPDEQLKINYKVSRGEP